MIFCKKPKGGFCEKVVFRYAHADTVPAAAQGMACDGHGGHFCYFRVFLVSVYVSRGGTLADGADSVRAGGADARLFNDKH